MRKKIVAGNWKMNKSFEEAEDLIADILEIYKKAKDENKLMVICPPFPYLELATDLSEDTPIAIGAQNVSNHAKGAYTGEVSASMLSSMDVSYCIIGHSERRKYFGETAEVLKEKVDILLNEGIKPIFCCGELLEEREQNRQFALVEEQISSGLFHLSKTDFENIVIAYEPVWAIGTGKTATPKQAQEMHAFIRQLIQKKYGAETANISSILYGGSCNAQNAPELFANPDVDGGLIGGASLNAGDFLKIYQSL